MAREDEYELAGRLIDAVLSMDLVAIRRLSQSPGGDPSHLGAKGITALHAAASLQDPRAMQLLLMVQPRGDIDCRSCPDLVTPLMVAAAWGRLTVLEDLLRAGADLDLIDIEGSSAWDYAAESPECLRAMKEAVLKMTPISSSTPAHPRHRLGSIVSKSDSESYVTCRDDISIDLMNDAFQIDQDNSQLSQLCQLIEHNLTLGSHKDFTSKNYSFTEESSNSDPDTDTSISLIIKKRPPRTVPPTTDPTKSEINSSCDTDSLRRNVAQLWGQNVPITKTTKRVYVRLYNRLSSRGECEQRQLQTRQPRWSPELSIAAGPQGQLSLTKWAHLEDKMIQSFENHKRWHVTKVFFNYLLLQQMDHDGSNMVEFLESIFYVGKGRSGRPYDHIREAIKTPTKGSKKLETIRRILDNGRGIVPIQVFHNIGNLEAFTREAAMIDALTLQRLTNAKRGEYHGVTLSWSPKDKSRLGAVLLHKCWKTYQAQTPRPIYKHQI